MTSAYRVLSSAAVHRSFQCLYRVLSSAAVHRNFQCLPCPVECCCTNTGISSAHRVLWSATASKLYLGPACTDCRSSRCQKSLPCQRVFEAWRLPESSPGGGPNNGWLPPDLYVALFGGGHVDAVCLQNFCTISYGIS